VLAAHLEIFDHLIHRANEHILVAGHVNKEASNCSALWLELEVYEWPLHKRHGCNP
jgi:hypothetical protein